MKFPVNGSSEILEVLGLSFAYPGGPEVLGGVSLRAERGERIGIIGPNGAGKTTLFLSICGVLDPTTGEVRVFGERVRAGKFDPEVGMIFQNPDDQLFSPSVREDVAFGPENLGVPREEVEARVAEAMGIAGVEHLAERAPHHLSGGEKRMVSIAGVLALRPGLVVYDEPSANLDLRSRRRLIEFLKRADHGLLISSHDLELILDVAERVILMDEGRVVAEGIPSEILSDEELMERHGLEKPHSLRPHRHVEESKRG